MKTTNLYLKYLVHKKDHLLEGLQDTLTLDSPFGNGKIVIDEKGTFKCPDTGEFGTAIDFLKHMHPGITTKGAERRLKIEQQTTTVSLNRASDQLATFQANDELVAIAAEQLGLTKKQVRSLPIYHRRRGNQFLYIDYQTQVGEVLSLSTFSSTKPLRRTEGIKTVPELTSSRIWVAENELMAFHLKNAFGEDAICWPTAAELEYYEYRTLLKDKTVIVVHSDFTYDYASSFYPFLVHIQGETKKQSYVRIDALTQGIPVGKWLQEPQHQNLLVEHANKNIGQQPISPRIYTKFIRSYSMETLPFAQGMAKEFFFYGTADGQMVHSYPVDVLPVERIEQNFDLYVVTPERTSSTHRLTNDRVIALIESAHQLTPRVMFEYIVKLMNEYVYFEDEDLPILLALYVMATYVHVLFPAFPYLHLHADKDSGKTTCLELLMGSCFNGVAASKITTARLAQEVSDTQCTLGLDEFERNTGGQGGAHVQLLNAGYRRSGQYLKQRGKNTSPMGIYSPKIYASIDSINASALDSRTLTIAMSRKPKHHPLKGWNKDNPEITRRLNEIVLGGYAIGLYYHDKVEYLLQQLPRQIQLGNGIPVDTRQRELIAPLVVLAQLIDLDSSGNSLPVERQLKRVLQAMLYPDHHVEVARIKQFTNQLREWREQPNLIHWTIKDEKVWIPTGSWDNTSFANQFNGGRRELINWCRGLSDCVERTSVHIPSLNDTVSCIGFPEDLILNEKPVIEWIRLDPEPMQD